MRSRFPARLLPRLCSLPVLVVMLSAWLVLLSPLPAGFLRLEQGLFDLFQGPANTSSRLALLQLAAEDAPLVLAPWLDPALFEALEQRLGDDGRLLLDVSPAALTRWVQAGPAPVPEAGRVERSREHRDTWRRWVREGRVVAPVDLATIPVSGGQPWDGHWSALPDWGIGSALAEAGRPGVLLTWLAGLESWRDWRWTDAEGLQLGQRRLPVAPDTRIVTARGTGGLVQALPAREAAAAAYRTPMAVLSADPARAPRLAAQAVSLQAGRYAAQPPWAGWLGRAVLLCAGLLGSLLIPRASVALAGLGLLALSLAVVAGQWLALQRAGLWLPLVPGLLWLLLLSPVLLGAGIARRERLALRARADHSDLQRGTWLLQQGRTDEAVAAVGSCAPGTAWLDLMYEIGLAQERQRQYREAARTYGQISARRRRYRDAAARAQSLRRLGLESGTADAGSRTLASTIALPAGSGLQLPQLGRYQLERELGRGAMGVVYLGRDARIDRAVALKTLNLGQFGAAEREAVKTRFYREATAAGRLDHPAIVRVYDVGEEPDLAYIAMQLVDGEPLSRHIAEDSLLAPATVYNIVATVADALDYAHRQQIVHRDIKPANILYAPDQRLVKVSDFGIARITDDSHTRTGEMLGSPLYMSAEQLKGQKITGASDLYSLGVSFFQLLSGGLPFVGDSIASLSYQIINGRPRSLRSYRATLSTGSVRLVNKAIQRNPGDRYRSGAEMAEAVRRALVREFGQAALW